jgi:hypothetical protein
MVLGVLVIGPEDRREIGILPCGTYYTYLEIAKLNQLFRERLVPVYLIDPC